MNSSTVGAAYPAPKFPEADMKDYPSIVLTYLLASGFVQSELKKNESDCGDLHHEIAILSYDCLRMEPAWREPATEAAFPAEFASSIVEAIVCRRKMWEMLLSMLINVFSGTYAWIAERFIAAGVSEMLAPLIMLHGSDVASRTRTPIGCTTSEIAIWCATSLSNTVEDSPAVASGLAPVVPALAHVSAAPRCVLEDDQEAAHEEEVRLLSFRGLCALVPPGHPVLKSVMGKQITEGLIHEYEVALQGGMLPGLGMLPHADTRAKTVSLLARDPENRAALVAAGVVPLLTQSLRSEVQSNAAATVRLWRYAVRALHSFATLRDKRTACPEKEELISGLLRVAGSCGGMQAEASTRLLAADAAVAFGARWDVERLLWLAVLKPQEERCILALLPANAIRMVMKWLVFLEVSAEEGLEIIPNRLLEEVD